MKLRIKIFSFVAVSCLISGGLILWITTNSVYSILVHQVSAIAIAECAGLSEKVVAGILADSEIEMLRYLELSHELTHANGAMVLDLKGRVLAHTNVSEKGKIYTDAMTRRELMSEEPSLDIHGTGLNSILEVSAPVYEKTQQDLNEQFLLDTGDSNVGSKRIGLVRLQIPLKEALLLRNKIVERMLVIMAIVGFTWLLATIWLVNAIIKPIRLLALGTDQISKGRYGTKIPVLSKDELGDLAANFNQMSQVLAETAVSKDFMSGILGRMLDALIIIDAQGCLRMTNPAACKLLGYEEHELIGRPIELIFSDKTQALRLQNESPFGSAEVSKNVEVTLLTKKGESVPALYSLSQLSETGEWILVARDMGERKRMELILRQSDKMSAVGQLAAGVAHEINNPLGVILGFAQALVRRLGAGDPLEMPLKSIEAEAIRCKNLVQDLLTFSRVSRIEREPIDFNQAIETSLSLVATKARTANITVEKEFSQGLPHVLANANQIQQVLINIATNAMDAMQPGGTLSIKTEQIAEGSLSWVALRIKDNGSGIPPEIIGRIFEPFFTTKGIGKGTGLGLSLVHEIIKKHSGSIEVKSSPGQTEFLVKLPCHSQASES